MKIEIINIPGIEDYGNKEGCIVSIFKGCRYLGHWQTSRRVAEHLKLCVSNNDTFEKSAIVDDDLKDITNEEGNLDAYKVIRLLKELKNPMMVVKHTINTDTEYENKLKELQINIDKLKHIIRLSNIDFLDVGRDNLTVEDCSDLLNKRMRESKLFE